MTLFLAGVLFLFLELYLLIYVKKNDNGKILDNVYIGRLDVSGMTEKEAEKALNKQLETEQKGILTLTTSEGKSTSATYEELGISQDAKKLAKKAAAYGKEGGLYKRYREIKKTKKEKCVIPARLTLDKKTAKAALEELCEPLFQQPVNASIRRENGKMVITEGKEGQKVDIDATIQTITKYLNQAWDGGDGSVELTSAVRQPNIQGKDLKEIGDLLGTFQTYYGAAATGSVANIEAGAAHINGSIVMPGEEFSANAAMEPYTEEEGYTTSGSYANGMLVQSMGGGICQVSSTLYNALLFAEVEITERMPHSMLVDYVEPSMDAAIADDVKDLKFVNNYKTPIFLESVLENGYLTFNVYGKETRSSGRTLEFISETLATEEPEGLRFVATDEAAGTYRVMSNARTGRTAQLWKVVYQDGEEVSRDVVNTSYYASAKKTIGVGTVTDDAEWKSKIQAAIASQDETQVKNAVYKQQEGQTEGTE